MTSNVHRLAQKSSSGDGSCANGSPVHGVLVGVLGERRAARLEDWVLGDADAEGPETTRDGIDRAGIADALALALTAELLERVPTGARYVEAERAAGRHVLLDHGALRTIDAPWTGALPGGAESFRRILVPLGYEEVHAYDLSRLHMTGRVFCHLDRPEQVAQHFVSELHAARLPDEAQAALRRVVEPSTDPLTDEALALLDRVAADGWLPVADATALVRALLPCFGRQHPTFALADYEVLLEHSAEAAWIATEGNAFNHATDRIDDVDAKAVELRDAGWPIKDTVEHSGSGRVRQTAFRADPATRTFLDADGREVEREVPGSFFELISRAMLPGDGGEGDHLDLAFDASNAQGIFTMTRPPSS